MDKAKAKARAKANSSIAKAGQMSSNAIYIKQRSVSIVVSGSCCGLLDFALMVMITQPNVYSTGQFEQPTAWFNDNKFTDAGGRLRGPKRYFPFAEGPRNCVGQSLAKQSMLGTTATLLSHFTFRLADKMNGPDGVREREMYSLITTIQGGLWMHAVPRI